MNVTIPLTHDQKLTVVYRVEPGCLGPDGLQQIQAFCEFAQKQIETAKSNYLLWVIVPRLDKTIDEAEYRLHDKRLPMDKVSMYLKMFDTNIDELEGRLLEQIALLIEDFLERGEK
ncbi:MAG: hypothetical protein OEX12_12395 [Gammaproteobacteria bacterium]|nr:hypothetical protein [Gammaproteobacteria bacterium]